jgi:hypothetical protein
MLVNMTQQMKCDLPCYQEPKVKVSAQERYGADIQEESADDTNDHNGMPRSDLNGHHEKFVEH